MSCRRESWGRKMGVILGAPGAKQSALRPSWTLLTARSGLDADRPSCLSGSLGGHTSGLCSSAVEAQRALLLRRLSLCGAPATQPQQGGRDVQCVARKTLHGKLLLLLQSQSPDKSEFTSSTNSTAGEMPGPQTPQLVQHLWLTTSSVDGSSGSSLDGSSSSSSLDSSSAAAESSSGASNPTAVDAVAAAVTLQDATEGCAAPKADQQQYEKAVTDKAPKVSALTQALNASPATQQQQQQQQVPVRVGLQLVVQLEQGLPGEYQPAQLILPTNLPAPLPNLSGDKPYSQQPFHLTHAQAFKSVWAMCVALRAVPVPLQSGRELLRRTLLEGQAAPAAADAEAAASTGFRLAAGAGVKGWRQKVLLEQESLKSQCAASPVPGCAIIHGFDLGS